VVGVAHWPGAIVRVVPPQQAAPGTNVPGGGRHHPALRFEEYRAAPSDNGSRGAQDVQQAGSYSYRFNHIASACATDPEQQLQDDVAMAAALWDGYQRAAGVKVGSIRTIHRTHA